MSKLLTSPTQAVGSTTQIHETTLQLAELPGMASESLEESAASDDDLLPLTSRADLPTESGLQKIIAVTTRMWKGAIISGDDNRFGQSRLVTRAESHLTAPTCYPSRRNLVGT